MKIKYIIAAVLVVAVGIWTFSSFTGTLTSYVSIAEAKQRTVRVQVMGEVDHERTEYDTQDQLLKFPIEDDEGDSMLVIYAGQMPGNFDQATHAICQGKYNGEVFEADQLLIKCPSKYQGEESQI